MSAPVLIDTDNAMGSRLGDVDDAFAIAALLKSGINISGIVSVFGNTDAGSAYENTRALQVICNTDITQVKGAAAPGRPNDEVTEFVNQLPSNIRVAALGPLTNVAHYPQSKIEEVVIVGGNSMSRGTVPPWWPNEFNLIKDRRAAAGVFASEVPLTILPLNVAVELKTTLQAIRELPEPYATYFYRHSKLWAWRSLLVRSSGAFPVWDLGAAMYLIRPRLFEIEEHSVRFYERGYMRLGESKRKIRLISRFDRAKVWTYFLELLKT